MHYAVTKASRVDSNSDTEPLGALLARTRRERGLSQAELAGRLGTSGPHVSRIEHGADLRVSTLLDIARELRLEPVLVPKQHVAAVRALLAADAREEALERPERGRFA